MFNLWDIELNDSAKLYWALPIILLSFIFLFKKQRLFTSALRILSAMLLCLTLAEPYYTTVQETNTLSVAFDISASVTKDAREAFLKQLEKYTKNVSNLYLWPFAQTPSSEAFVLDKNPDSLAVSSVLDKENAEINSSESNLQKVLNKVNDQSKTSTLLFLSDGQETIGNALEEAKLSAEKGISIFPLVPEEKLFQKETLSISNLYAPLVAPANESVEVRATVNNSSNQNEEAKFELYFGEKKLFSQTLNFQANRERVFEVKIPPLTKQADEINGGLTKLRAILSNSDSGKVKEENYRFITVKENEKILLLSGDPDDEKIIKNLISLKGYSLEAVDLSKKQISEVNFENDNTVILNNVSYKMLGANFLSKLEEFVKSGGGLLMIAGDRSFGLGGLIDTPLEDVSPVKFVPPQTEKRRLNNAIVLCIDKSGSMADDNKIYSAKMAALSSIQSLKDEDYVGVIGFDAAPLTIIDPKPVKEAKLEAERRLRNLTAIGKTNLLPALALARQRLQPLKNFRKHIIVLSDGKIPISDYEYVLERDNLRKEGITVSAIALGIEADIPFMRILSKENKGAFHQTLDAGQLPDIFIDDIKVATGEKTIHENMEFPVALGPAEIKSTTFTNYPDLLGFVETLPKKGSNLELITTKEEKVFPILSSWKYGSGKVIAYTSDISGRWSSPWVRWKDFSNFWSEIINQVKNKTDQKSGNVQFDFRFFVEKKDLILDLAIFDENLKTASTPKINLDLFHANGKNFKLEFNEQKKGRYSAKLNDALAGDYKAHIFYGNLKFPEIAFNLSPNSLGEIVGAGLNLELLENIAYLTGGKINPQAEEVLKNTRKISTKNSLITAFFILAFMLIIIEAFLRERFNL